MMKNQGFNKVIMNSIYLDKVPGIQNLTDMSAEKYCGGAVKKECTECCPEIAQSVNVSPNSNVNITADGDINIFVFASGNNEVNLGDVSLIAGGNINITTVENSEININAAA